MSTQKLVFLTGPVDISERDELGRPVGTDWMGNVSEFTLNFSVEKDELRESYSGANSLLSTVVKSKTVKGTLKCNDHASKQMARNLQSTVVSVPAGTTVDLAVGDLVAGQPFYLSHINLTEATLKAGSTELVLNTDYTIDLATGRGIALADNTGVTESTSYGASQSVGLFTQSQKDFYIRYSGKNQIDGKPYVFEGFKIRVDPLNNLSLIGTTHGSYDLTFDVLIDEFRTGSLGGFGDLKMA